MNSKIFCLTIIPVQSSARSKNLFSCSYLVLYHLLRSNRMQPLRLRRSSTDSVSNNSLRLRPPCETLRTRLSTIWAIICQAKMHQKSANSGSTRAARLSCESSCLTKTHMLTLSSIRVSSQTSIKNWSQLTQKEETLTSWHQSSTKSWRLLTSIQC